MCSLMQAGVRRARKLPQPNIRFPAGTFGNAATVRGRDSTMATNDGWLRQVQEETIDPALPICDPHHHLWDHREGRVERRYLLDEIQRDLQSGHTIVSTVFIEHLAMYRAEGPPDMKYVG